jgi:hypothetical protein
LTGLSILKSHRELYLELACSFLLRAYEYST